MRSPGRQKRGSRDVSGTKGFQRRLPVGAEVVTGGVHFRVWAPDCHKVEVVIETDKERRITASRELRPEPDGYFSALVPDIGAGALYRFRVNDRRECPDPASRFQPQGPHGPSQAVDPGGFAWTDRNWCGIKIERQVIYEMHIGTFTPEGTWDAALRELAELAEAGITLLEVMPVADFPGSFGWGYDGVDLYAPTRLYGAPDDFRRFVDQAHAAGLGVILDVVYNHLGADGDYAREFSRYYYTSRYRNEWGPAINYDGENSGPVREFIIENAGYWIDEYHLDGLRLDATQTMFDSSRDHIVAAITRRVRDAAKGRATIVVAENESQETSLLLPVAEGGSGIDALWNDDFHHSALVALTGRNEAYYSDHLGSPQEFISALKWGFLYQGQYYSWQGKRRGEPCFGIKPASFVLYIENHDQIANSARGLRLHRITTPALYRALTALLLLAPGTPMLFQGQEFASSSPFLYFADHKPDLAKAVIEGRREFLGQFSSLATPEMQAILPDPTDPQTFMSSKLDLTERRSNKEAYALHRDLLRLRKGDPVFRAQKRGGIDGAVLGEGAFVLRFFGREHGDRLLVVNLGADRRCGPFPEPLLAPPEESVWRTVWSSEDPRYGGNGTPPFNSDRGPVVPGKTAIVLDSRPEG